MKFIFPASVLLVVLSSSSLSVVVNGHGYKPPRRNNDSLPKKQKTNLRVTTTSTATAAAQGGTSLRTRGLEFDGDIPSDVVDDNGGDGDGDIPPDQQQPKTLGVQGKFANDEDSENGDGHGEVKPYGVKFFDDGHAEHILMDDNDDSRTADDGLVDAKKAGKGLEGGVEGMIGPKSVGGVVVSEGDVSPHWHKHGNKIWAPPLMIQNQPSGDDDDEDGGGNGGSTRIVGGSSSSKGEFPYFVDLRPGGTGCGATLIAPRIVMTAAHCTNADDSDDDNFVGRTIHVSAYRRDDSGDGAIPVRVQKQKSHPDFDSPVNLANDFSLLLLRDAVDIDEPKAVISLDGGRKEPEEGTTLRVIGLGRTSSGGDSPSKLRDVEVPVVDVDECADMYGGSKVNDRVMFCAGDTRNGGEDSCQGDSGGPIVIEKNNKVHELVGVVSWGISCADRRYPGVYAKVGRVNDWIKKTVCDDWNVSGDDAGTICGEQPTPSPINPQPTPSPTPVPPTPSPTRDPTPQPTQALSCAGNSDGKTLAVDFLVTTDDWGYETSYEIKDRDSNTMFAEDGQDGNLLDFTTYRWNDCVDPTKCTEITVFDSRNDGFCCTAGCGSTFCAGNAQIELKLDGDRVIRLKSPSEVDFESSWSTTVGDCSANPDPTPEPTPFPTPAEWACDADKIGVEWRFLTDRYASESRWALRYAHGERIDGDDDLEDATMYDANFCLLQTGCYILRLDDTHGDGFSGTLADGADPYFYQLRLNGQTVIDQTLGSNEINFGKYMERQFGDCDSTIQCSNNQMLVIWEFRTDGHGDEVSWELVNSGNGEVVQGSTTGTYEDNNLYKFQMCVRRGRRYRLRFLDDHGDGNCCGGVDPYYTLTVDGTTIVDDHEPGRWSERDFDFGDDDGDDGSDGGPDPTPSPTPAQPGPTPSPTPASPTPSPTPLTTEGILQPSDCNNNERLVYFEIQMDGYGEETSWELTDDNGNSLMGGGQNGDYVDAETYRFTRCVPENKCHILTIFDSYGDGQCCGGDETPYYKIEYGTATIANMENDRFGDCVSYSFGKTGSLCENLESPSCPDVAENSDGGSPSSMWTTVFTENFNNGWGVFERGSQRAGLTGTNSKTHGSGGQALKIRGDNPNKSFAFTGPHSVDGKTYARLTFYYLAHEDVDGQDHFEVGYSGDGNSYTRLQKYDFGSDGFVQEETWYSAQLEWDITSLSNLYIKLETDLDEGKMYFDDVTLETK